MKRWLRRGLLAAAGVGLLAFAGVQLGAWLGDRKAARRVDVAVQAVAMPSDAAALERGRYLYASRGCADCHGAGGGGKAFIDEPGGALYVKAPDISGGGRSAVLGYQPADWVRAIRHGVKPDGRPLFIMPSEDYNRITDADLGALVAYVRQLPAAGGTPFEARVPKLVMTMYAAGLITDAAEKIDHTLPPSPPVPEDGSVRHGAYVGAMCVGCHGARLSGGRIPGTPPDWPAAANLTPGAGSGMTAYAAAEPFAAMLRSGRRPDGSPISRVMPFESLRELSDRDVRALHAWLRQLPPVAAGNR